MLPTRSGNRRVVETEGFLGIREMGKESLKVVERDCGVIGVLVEEVTRIFFWSGRHNCYYLTVV